MTNNLVKGGCLCAAVQYHFDKINVISAHHCHCKDCQKSTGSGKATIVLVPSSLITIEGEIKFYTVTGKDGGHVSRGFCSECGSQLISYLEEMQEIKFVKAGSLMDSSWIEIQSSFWSSTAQHWSPIDEEITNFTHNPNNPLNN